MRATFTKTFHFSASFEKNGKIHGHNYALAVTTDAMDETEEAHFEREIDEALIRKIASRDWGLDVDFLRDVERADHRFLETFSRIIREVISPLPLYALALERGRGARTEIVWEGKR